MMTLKMKVCGANVETSEWTETCIPDLLDEFMDHEITTMKVFGYHVLTRDSKFCKMTRTYRGNVDQFTIDVSEN